MFGPMPKNYVVVYAKKVHLLRNKIIDLEQIMVVLL
jgi:hypothetical protein